MEYVDGKTLADRIDAGGPLPPDEVAALALDLAEALHVVHEKGIVHRDIKPSNVLLWSSPLPDRAFRAKLTDFGIAYLLDATRVTSPGTVIGTAAYLAPEQVRGEKPTTAADIYSLGLLLLEALTGRRAFAHAVGHEAIVARLTISPSIPDDLPDAWRAVLTAMTAANPTRRPTALHVALTAPSLRGPQASSGGSLPGFVDPGVTVPTGVEPPPETSILTPDSLTRTQIMPDAAHEDRAAPSPGRPRRRIVGLVSIVAALIVAAAIAVGIAATVANEPDPSPTLPAVEEPLGTHLDELLDAVTP
jgi:serine/threonine protein kinase